jgi:hypothetical protein
LSNLTAIDSNSDIFALGIEVEILLRLTGAPIGVAVFAAKD